MGILATIVPVGVAGRVPCAPCQRGAANRVLAAAAGPASTLPLGLGRQAVSQALVHSNVGVFEPPALVAFLVAQSVDRRRSFAFAEPVTEVDRLVPRNIGHRESSGPLATLRVGPFGAFTRRIVAHHRKKLRSGDFAHAQIERSRQTNPLGWKLITLAFLLRRSHHKLARRNQDHLDRLGPAKRHVGVELDVPSPGGLDLPLGRVSGRKRPLDVEPATMNRHDHFLFHALGVMPPAQRVCARLTQPRDVTDAALAGRFGLFDGT